MVRNAGPAGRLLEVATGPKHTKEDTGTAMPVIEQNTSVGASAREALQILEGDSHRLDHLLAATERELSASSARGGHEWACALHGLRDELWSIQDRIRKELEQALTPGGPLGPGRS